MPDEYISREAAIEEIDKWLDAVGTALVGKGPCSMEKIPVPSRLQKMRHEGCVCPGRKRPSGTNPPAVHRSYSAAETASTLHEPLAE